MKVVLLLVVSSDCMCGPREYLKYVWAI